MNMNPLKKMLHEKAPNRLLDLDELESPFFRGILQKMDRLLEEENGLYLHPSKRWEYPWALERAGLTPGSRVLDAGCGASVFPLFLATEGYRVSALDYDAPPLPASHRSRPDLLQGDLAALPFKSESFEAVFCISVLEHLSPDGVRRSLQELRRVLVPGGKLLVTTDFFEDADARIWYEGPDEVFPVDWQVFDEFRLRQHLLCVPGLQPDGAVDLSVDWESTSSTMIGFHGYPYTSVGITLVKD